MGLFGRKEKRLGVSEGKRRYDLPLNKSEGSDFLILLVALMMFLATAALCASFALGAMSARWSSGLENKATVEIAAETKEGRLRSAQDVKTLTAQAREVLEDSTIVKSSRVLEEKDIQDLIAPWLGEDAALEGIPLPGLIAVEFNAAEASSIEALESSLKKIAPDIRIDTHESWLNDILRFTGALQLAAAAIVLVIGATTVTAIAGAVRSRIALNKADVELLHLMGATDEYITRQFQRHALALTLRGSITGVLAGALAMGLIGFLSSKSGAVLIPDFSLTPVQTGILIALPFLACIIGSMTARFTVLRSLSRMP